MTPSKRATVRVRALLAEDTPADARVLAHILRKRGHEVVVAQDGRETVEQCRRRRFDVILMDVEMPAMDGLEAAAAIRAWAGRRVRTATPADVPIIAVTGHPVQGVEAQCLAAGMNAFVPKPVDADRVLQLVEQQAQAHLRSASASQSASQPAGASRTSTPRRRDGSDGVEGHSPADDAVLDLDAAIHRLGNDRELLDGLISIFVADAPRFVRRIEAGLADPDPAEACRAAHSLKSLAASLGASRVVAAAVEVENALACGQCEEARRSLAGLRPQIEQVLEALRGES